MKPATKAAVTNPITAAIATAHLKDLRRSASEPLGRSTGTKRLVSILTSASSSSCPTWCLSMMPTGILIVEADESSHTEDDKVVAQGQLPPLCNKMQKGQWKSRAQLV